MAAVNRRSVKDISVGRLNHRGLMCTMDPYPAGSHVLTSESQCRFGLITERMSNAGYRAVLAMLEIERRAIRAFGRPATVTFGCAISSVAMLSAAIDGDRYADLRARAFRRERHRYRR